MTPDALKTLRAQQDEEDAIADDFRTAIGEEQWRRLIDFNTYGSMACNLQLRFFRSPSGHPACEFRSIRA